MADLDTPETGEERDVQTLKDVSHTPPSGDTVTNVWYRGEG